LNTALRFTLKPAAIFMPDMPTTALPAPDIEIYIQQTSHEMIEAWLSSRFPAGAPLVPRPSGKKQWRLLIQNGGQQIPVLIIEEASPGFSSVWFNSAATPWSDDIACAREAHAHFQVEVRATPSSWQEGDDPDLWWKINADGEGLLQWPG
jgi:hypothetical protein